MAYRNDMAGAADRHYRDASKLLEARCLDNSGYHFGLAAECAIKRQLSLCGVPQDDASIWTHWPDLRQLAIDAIHGRSGASLRTLLAKTGFMQEWNIRMRYAPTGSVTDTQVARWKEHANDAIGLLI